MVATTPYSKIETRRPRTVFIRGRSWTASELLLGASILWTIIVGLLFLLVCIASERHWLGTLAVFVPKVVLLGPTVLLLLASIIVRPGLALLHLVSVALIVGPIMGLTVPLTAQPAEPKQSLRIVSFNLQNGESGRLMEASAELDFLDADLICLQETQSGCEDVLAKYSARHHVRQGEFCVLSKFPIREVAFLKPTSAPRERALLCEVDLPGGTVRVGNVHLPTPRFGILKFLNPTRVLNGTGAEQLEADSQQRFQEIRELAELLRAASTDKPLILAGDFNMPSTSSLYQEAFGGANGPGASQGPLQNTFDVAGTGYGYTAPCHAGRWWPENTPWARIDHILVPPAWTVYTSEVGELAGSDHRLIVTTVSPAVSE